MCSSDLGVTTGEVRHERLLAGPKLDSLTIADNVNQPQGALPDIMLGDGERIYMRELALAPDLSDAAEQPERLRPVGGFLDDTYFRRAPWRLGRNWGRVISYNDDFVYTVRMFESLHGLDPENYFTPGDKGYRLLGGPRQDLACVDVANSEIGRASCRERV